MQPAWRREENFIDPQTEINRVTAAESIQLETGHNKKVSAIQMLDRPKTEHPIVVRIQLNGQTSVKIITQNNRGVTANPPREGKVIYRIYSSLTSRSEGGVGGNQG